MNIYPIKIILFVSLLLYKGMVIAETVPQPPQNQNKPYMEQAADHFDAFVRQVPIVIAANLNAFRTRGFRAIFLDDPETQPAEEAMIDSLVKGLQALGSALLEDLEAAFAVRQESIGSPQKLPEVIAEIGFSEHNSYG
jgi:hypothetical protein